MLASEFMEDNKYHLIINSVKQEWWDKDHFQPIKGIKYYYSKTKELEKDNHHYHCIVSIEAPQTTIRSRVMVAYGLVKGQVKLKHISTEDYLKKVIHYVIGMKKNMVISNEIPDIEYSKVLEEPKKNKKESIFKEWLKIKDEREWDKISIINYIKCQYIEKNKMFSDNVLISLTQNMMCIINKDFNRSHSQYLSELINKRLEF